MLYTRVNFSQFCDQLSDFSYQACRYLYDYYNNRWDFIEFDPIGISCDWSEYTYEEFFNENRDYMNVDDGEYDDDEIKDLVLDYLTERDADPIDLGDTVLFMNV